MNFFIQRFISLINGKKMNTGTIVVLAAFILQHFLGVTQGAATEIVTNIMMGIGGITALVGYIHKFFKK